MLVIKRKTGQSVSIQPPGQDEIVVTVVDWDRSSVKLSITANNDVSIIRDNAKIKTK